MRGLAKSVGLQLEWCMQKELDSETKPKYEIVKQFFLFFFWERYCLHCPWAFSVFNARYPEISISFAAFCKLRPKNVLLLKNTPMDQCKCKTYENFVFKLSALKINYDDDLSEKCLCEVHIYIRMLGWWMSGTSRWKKNPFIELLLIKLLLTTDCRWRQQSAMHGKNLHYSITTITSDELLSHTSATC